MALNDLLAKLERDAGTAGTADVPTDVPAKPAPILAGTAGTAGTAEKDKGGGDSSETPSVRATRWLIHYADRNAAEVWASPACTHAEALALYQGAVAAEPIQYNPGKRTANTRERNELLAGYQRKPAPMMGCTPGTCDASQNYRGARNVA